MSERITEFHNKVATISDLSKKVYNGHSYATGYFEATLVSMFKCLNAKDQRAFLEQFQKGKKLLEERMVDRLAV